MKTIGVSMIVKNESEMICACLDSVKGVDEIVIVDTGSEVPCPSSSLPASWLPLRKTS
jgi:hypothetical protein